MALNPVTLMEVLRPWRIAGISHILGLPEAGDPSEQDVDALLTPPATSLPAHMEAEAQAGKEIDTHNAAPRLLPPSAPVTHARSGTAPHGGASVTTSAQPAAMENTIQAPASGIAAGAGAATASSSPALFGGRKIPDNLLPKQGTTRAAAPPRTAAPVKAASSACPPNMQQETWPPSWQALWQKTHPAPIVWTYCELAADLAGHGSPERSQLMRSLIGSLALPKGSSAFWPVTAMADEQSENTPACFAGAMARLAPKVIVAFGATALPYSGLGVQLTVPFTQQICGGKMVVLLPETAVLLADPSAKEKAAAFLRAQFASIPSLFFHKG